MNLSGTVLKGRYCIPVSYTHLDVYKRQDVWILIEKGDILCLKIYAWLFREYGHI